MDAERDNIKQQITQLNEDRIQLKETKADILYALESYRNSLTADGEMNLTHKDIVFFSETLEGIYKEENNASDSDTLQQRNFLTHPRFIIALYFPEILNKVYTKESAEEMYLDHVIFFSMRKCDECNADFEGTHAVCKDCFVKFMLNSNPPHNPA